MRLQQQLLDSCSSSTFVNRISSIGILIPIFLYLSKVLWVWTSSISYYIYLFFVFEPYKISNYPLSSVNLNYEFFNLYVTELISYSYLNLLYSRTVFDPLNPIYIPSFFDLIIDLLNFLNIITYFFKTLDISNLLNSFFYLNHVPSFFCPFTIFDFLNILPFFFSFLIICYIFFLLIVYNRTDFELLRIFFFFSVQDIF